MFSEQYKHPKWQEKRLEALSERGFQCEMCGDEENMLHVHHKHYIKGRKIWEYETEEFLILCNSCHSNLHEELDEIKQTIGEINPECYCDLKNLLNMCIYLNPSEFKEVSDDCVQKITAILMEAKP